jgi:hypothetical protein
MKAGAAEPQQARRGPEELRQHRDQSGSLAGPVTADVARFTTPAEIGR